MNKYSFDLDPAHIGELVAIQVFKRNEPDGDLIDPSSLVKHVGILQGYILSPHNVDFWFEGLGPVTVNLHTHSYEVYDK